MIERTIYVTDDGREFDDEDEARTYENSSFLNRVHVTFLSEDKKPLSYADADDISIIIIRNISDEDLGTLYNILTYDIGYDIERWMFTPHSLIYWDERKNKWTAWGTESEAQLSYLQSLKELYKRVKTDGDT